MEATSLPRGRALLLPRRLLAALDDDRLVDQLRRGNAAAFEVIYDRHHRGILAYCRHLLGSREEAEDAVQHTFVAVHDGIVGDDREIKLKAWLYTIARNRCLSVLRARREYAAELDEVAATAGLAEEVQQRADLRDLLADLRELPEPQRAALVLSEVADLAHAEIAQVLDCDVAKVKSLVFQARSGLIERRQARDTSCEEIREQLATLRGGSLRRGPLRRHLKACPGCAAYRDDIKRQRQLLAIALPVIPTVGLKESALAAVGLSGAGAAGSAGVAAVAGGGAATGAAVSGGGATGSGGLGAAMGVLAAKAGVAKIAVAVVATTAAVGGGTVAVTQQSDLARESGGGPEQRQPEQAPGSGEAPSGGPPAIAPGADDRRGEDRAARRRRGIDEQTGEHRGERGRDNARTRGRGRQRGLEGAPPPGGRAEREERGERQGARRQRPAERRREARRTPRAERRTRPRRRRPTPPPRLPPPRPERAPQPAPGPPPEPAPETAPEPTPVPEPDAGTRVRR